MNPTNPNDRQLLGPKNVVDQGNERHKGGTRAERGRQRFKKKFGMAVSRNLSSPWWSKADRV